MLRKTIQKFGKKPFHQAYATDKIKWDLSKSRGSYLIDKHGKKYLDFHGGYGSNPLGWNHPKLSERLLKRDPSFWINKPANGDFPTQEVKEFQKAFYDNDLLYYLDYPWMFFIDGGALAVENALKIAMDWKTIKTGNQNNPFYQPQIVHLEKAFHGRSGYTMSLTNTDPNKIKHFSKFESWPRLTNLPYYNDDTQWNFIEDDEKQSLQQFENILQQDQKSGRNVIAALIIEPIQGEGGDNYFRKEYLQGLQTLCLHYDVLLICDEVQTGFYSTGKPWAFQHYDLKPDLVSFGKKSQQCGVFGGGERLEILKGGCFTTPGRISSTWSGNLVDMVRATEIMRIIKEDNLPASALQLGHYWKELMCEAFNLHPRNLGINSIRNLGLWLAFDFRDSNSRDILLQFMEKEGLLGLGSGEKTIRFRPNLAITQKEVSECVIKTIAAIDEFDYEFST